MKTKLLFLILLLSGGLMAQKTPRVMLNGQLTAESISVEDVLITNKTAKTAAVSKKDGTFQLLVRVKDTLVFSGFNFPRQVLVLNEADLKFKTLKIRIESQATNLEDVIINPKALTGNLSKDSENIKLSALKADINMEAAVTKLYEYDEKSSPDNKLMPGYLDGTYMMDFAKIGKKLVRSFKRSEAQKNRNRDVSSFTVVVQSRFSNDFFRNSLKLTETEIPAFLNFCEKDSKSKQILESYTDFELVQYLEEKNKEFKALKK